MAILRTLRDVVLALYFIVVPLLTVLWSFALGGSGSGPVGVALMLVGLAGAAATAIAGLRSLGTPPSVLNGVLLIVGGGMMGAIDGTIATLGGTSALASTFVFG